MRNSALPKSIALVVDDHPETLQFLIDALEAANVTVLVATNGERAIEQVQLLMPDLILLDAVMPGMDGFETCRALKAGPALNVPVIFMTALEETEDIVRGFNAGGIDYLTKPIAPDELLARMRVHLAHARSVRDVRAALDMSGQTMLAADAQGSLRWATLEARRVLARLAQTTGASAILANCTDPAASSSELPVQVRTWVTDELITSGASTNSVLVVQAQEIRVRFCLLSRIGDDEVLLTIQQENRIENEHSGSLALQRHLSLTAREAEVLYWLSRGNANRDIAEILGMSPRTVDKHLEHIYGKIGVDSRAGAVALAVQKLRAP